LLPSDAVLRTLEDGAAFLERGEFDCAARLFARAAESAADGDDRAGYGRAQAQLAALEESRGEVDKAFGHNRLAQEAFLAIGTARPWFNLFVWTDFCTSAAMSIRLQRTVSPRH